MSVMVDCPFCDESRLEGEVLSDGELVRVVLSNPRLLPGHVPVIPKRHVEQPWELTDEEVLEIFGFIRDFERRIVDRLAAGCDIRQNYRPFLPQGRVKVDHVHFHLIPRDNEDELYQKSMKFERELFAALTPEEERRMVEVLGKLH